MEYNKKLYSDKTLNLLKNTLGDYKCFIKSNKENRKKIAKRIKDISILSESSTFYSDNKESIQKIISELGLKKDVEEFKIILKNRIEEPVTRKNSGFLNNQFRKSLLFSIDVIKKNFFDIDPKLSYDSFLESIDYDEFLFYVLNSAISCLEIKSYTTIESKDSNSIDGSSFYYKLRERLFIYTLIKLIEVNKLEKTEDVFFIDIIKNTMSFLNRDLSDSFNNLTKQVEEIFIFCFKIEIEKVTSRNNRGELNTKNILIIPQSIVESSIISTHLPEIVEPSEWAEENLENQMKIYKNIHNGKSDSKMSKEAKLVLNKSQKKKFRLNKKAIEIYDYLDIVGNDYSIDMLPFTPIPTLRIIKNELLKLKEEIGEEEILKIKKWIRKEYSESGRLSKNYLNKLEIETGIDIEILNKQKKYYKLKKEYKSRVRLRVLHNTIISVAKIYDGFPIFFINSIDYRSRMYPWSWLFSRTTGHYKYLMTEYESRKLTNRGLHHLISAYYYNFNEYFEKFNNISKSNKEKKEYKEIIRDNYKKIPEKDILKKSSFFYILLLEKVIEEVFEKNFISNFMIEVDQKSSSSVFLALVTGNKKLADESNFNSSKGDPAKFLMSRSEEYFSKNTKIDYNSIEILKNSRKLHKYTFMCFCYNEGSSGRFKKMLDYNILPKSASIIARSYPDFVDTYYKGLTKQTELLNTIVNYVLIKGNKGVEIITLDGCRISWKIFEKNKMSQSKKKYINPITGLYKSFHVTTYNVESIDIRKMISSFLPNLIHSMDAAIMRQIISSMLKKKYIINHLHDSVQTHPNYLDELYESIKEVYSELDSNKIFEKCFEKPMKGLLLSEDYEGFDKLTKEYRNSAEVVKIDDNFKAENMYPYE
jgi:hypothetical protein